MSQDNKDDLASFLHNLKETISAGNTQQTRQKNTMAACQVRFSGQQHQEAVEEFLNAVETFKTLENIDDDEALKGISLLFTGTASIWWQGVRNEANTWQDCLKLIKEHFAPTKAPHQLYMEIFGEKQDEKMGINLFVIRKRALFAQLPEGRHSEEVQIDMIYGLIHFKYRQYMRREDISTYQELLQKARDIEQIHMEAAMENGEKSKPKRCSFCNYRGHTAEECRRRQQKQTTMGDQKSEKPSKSGNNKSETH